MSFLKKLLAPKLVDKINYGYAPNSKVPIKSIASGDGYQDFKSAYLIVGKGHIRMCVDNVDDTPVTVVLNSYRTEKNRGITSFLWDIHNGMSIIGQLRFIKLDNDEAIWVIEFMDGTPSIEIITTTISF